MSGAMANEHQNHCRANYLVARTQLPIVTTKGDTFQLSTLTLGDLDSATTASTPAVITDLTPMLIYRAPLSIEMLNAIFGGTVPNRPDVPEPSYITMATTNDNPVARMLPGDIRDRNHLRGGSVEILVGSNDSSLYSAAACQGSHLAVAAGRTIHCWDSETTSTHTDAFTTPADVVALAVSGEWLAAALADHRIMLWNRKGLSDSPLILPAGNHPITKLIISKNDTWLAGVSDSILEIWPLNVQSLLQVLKNKPES